MKITVCLEGDYYADWHEIRQMICVKEMFIAISDAREKIRSRLKYGQDVSEKEAEHLEELARTLYIPAVEEC